MVKSRSCLQELKPLPVAVLPIAMIPVTVFMVPGAPRATRVIVRPWLLAG